MAREVDDERLVSIVRDVLVGRLRFKDGPVDVIRSVMESVLVGLAEDMEYEDDFDPMGADTVGYEMVWIGRRSGTSPCWRTSVSMKMHRMPR